MNWLLFVDVLAVMTFIWTFAGISFFVYAAASGKYDSVKISGFGIILFLMSFAYGIARIFG